MKGRPGFSGRAHKRPAYWWSRARVLAGLQRFYRDTGEMPTGRHAYERRALVIDSGRMGAERLYPSGRSVLRYWPSFAAAWREAGFGTDPGFRPRVEQLTGLLALLWGPRLVRNRLGERYGRLTVVGLAGFVRYARYDRALWLCACDCGGARVVDVGNLNTTQTCLVCSAFSDPLS